MRLSGSSPRPRHLTGLLAALLIASTTHAAPAMAQEHEPAMPWLVGPWEGIVQITGHLASDSEPSRGGFAVSVTNVQADSDISLDFEVADDDTIVGTMPVTLKWISETAGADSSDDPFYNLTWVEQTGTLTLSGDSDELVASGTLERSTLVTTDLETVEEVSGENTDEVRWVFIPSRSDCPYVWAPLSEAEGKSIVRTALMPAESKSGPTTSWNQLTVQVFIWPKSLETPSSEKVAAAEAEVARLYDDLRSLTIPRADLLWDFIDAWHDLRSEISNLNGCQTGVVPVASDFDLSFFKQALQVTVEAAVEGWEAYEAQELIDIYEAALSQGSVSPDSTTGYQAALRAMLDEAIAGSDTDAISVIATYAGEKGYGDLEAKAKAALG